MQPCFQRQHFHHDVLLHLARLKLQQEEEVLPEAGVEAEEDEVRAHPCSFLLQRTQRVMCPVSALRLLSTAANFHSLSLVGSKDATAPQESSEYETDSEEDETYGRQLLKPQFVPKAEREVRAGAGAGAGACRMCRD